MSEAESVRSRLFNFAGVRHAFFTRRGGASSGVYASLNGGVGSCDDIPALSENRRRMAEALGLRPERLLIPYQIHSAATQIVEEPWAPDERPRCDGLATRMPGLAIGVTGADCGMVLFYDPNEGVIGAAHAGWKGALGGALEATVEAMEKLGARAARVRAALGPTIGADSYEVGPELVEQFTQADDESRICFRARPGSDRSSFDLPRYIAIRLRRAGIGLFDDLGLDTYADETRFFSYRRSQHRREADYGRLVSAIALV